MNKVIVNCETGEQETIPLEGEELANFLANEKAVADAEKTKAEAELAKSNERMALLNRLGITEEEARLLLGGN